MKRGCCLTVLLAWILILAVSSPLRASAYMVLWENNHNVFIDYETGERVYLDEQQELEYVDSFNSIETCQKAKEERLEHRVSFELGIEDGVRLSRKKMSQTEIEKYKRQNPYELEVARPCGNQTGEIPRPPSYFC